MARPYYKITLLTSIEGIVLLLKSYLSILYPKIEKLSA